MLFVCCTLSPPHGKLHREPWLDPMSISLTRARTYHALCLTMCLATHPGQVASNNSGCLSNAAIYTMRRADYYQHDGGGWLTTCTRTRTHTHTYTLWEPHTHTRAEHTHICALAQTTTRLSTLAIKTHTHRVNILFLYISLSLLWLRRGVCVWVCTPATVASQTSPSASDQLYLSIYNQIAASAQWLV